MTVPINVHASCGQSNGWGSGSLSLLPTPQPGTAIVCANNSFPNGVGSFTVQESRSWAVATSTYSAWPAFQMERWRLTGVESCMLPLSVGSTAMSSVTDSGNGHWGRDGHWFGYATDMISASLSYLSAIGYAPTLRSCEWNQGEAEAGFIQSSAIAKEEARDMLIDIANHWGEVFPGIPFNIYRSGIIAGYEKGYAGIRWAQEEAAHLVPHATVVFRNAISAVERNLLNATDHVHWNQTLLNEAGTLGARNGLMPSGSA